MRDGQAGFFTDEELASSGGVLWEPARREPHRGDGPLDPPAGRLRRRARFSRRPRCAPSPRATVATASGRGFERDAAARAHAAHRRRPHAVPRRGDRARPARRAVGPRLPARRDATVTPDDWFFDGHFKNDPCMPGTLMFEGCLQAMAFYLAALGYTVDRDGWRFEPVPEQKYPMRCRGQVTPDVAARSSTRSSSTRSRGGPMPDRLRRPALHRRRAQGLPRARAWACGWCPTGRSSTGGSSARTEQPRTRRSLPRRLVGYVEPKPVASIDGFASTTRRCSRARGAGPRRPSARSTRASTAPRRVAAPARAAVPLHVAASRGRRRRWASCRPGASVEVEYDVPPDAWYFDENGAATMPFCVLHGGRAAALRLARVLRRQRAHRPTTDLLFRNLDGTGTLLAEIAPDDRHAADAA